MSGKSILAVVMLFTMIGLVYYPNAYAWNPSPQITNSLDSLGNTVLTIQFDFAQMANPPTMSHFPTEFQVRTSMDGSSWTELPSAAISPTPTTTVFTETYNLGQVSGSVQVQARLRCSIHNWSNWGPDPGVPVPEFPSGVVTVISLLSLVGGLFLVRRKRLAQA